MCERKYVADFVSKQISQVQKWSSASVKADILIGLVLEYSASVWFTAYLDTKIIPGLICLSNEVGWKYEEIQYVARKQAVFTLSCSKKA